MSRGALDRDVPALRVHDGAADREPEAEPARLLPDGTRSEEALKEPVLLIQGYAGSLIRDRNPHVSVNAFSADRYAGALRRVLAGVRDEVGEDLRRTALVGDDAVGVGLERLDQLLSFRLEHRLDERHRLGERVLQARGLGAHLERAGLDAAGVHQIFDEVLEPEGAPPESSREQRQLVAGHVERIVDDEVKRSDEPRDRRAQLVRDLHEELFFESQELGLGGDVADRVERASTREWRRNELKDAHALLTREPRAAHGVSLDLLDTCRARDEQELFKNRADERIFAEDAERRGIRAHDETLLVGQDDPIAQRDEGLGEGRLIEGGIFASPPGDSASFRCRLIGHASGITRRTRVPWPGLESSESCAPMRRADSRIWRRPRLPREA